MKNRKRLAMYAVGGLVGLCLICGVIGALIDPEPQARAPATDAATSIAEASIVAVASTNTPVPTSTQAPTDTPAPTHTSIPPTATPVPPTPTPAPQPVTIQGSGQTVTDPFTPPAAVNRIVFSHRGTRNFAVQVFDEQGKSDLLVNEIGNYDGAHPLFSQGGKYFFEVTADGPWSARVEPVAVNSGHAQGVDGNGAFVSDAFMPDKQGAVPYRFTHTGKRNFAVYLHCAGGSDLLQNEIGAVDNQAVVRFVDGPCLWQVQADGQWSVRPK